MDIFAFEKDRTDYVDWMLAKNPEYFEMLRANNELISAAMNLDNTYRRLRILKYLDTYGLLAGQVEFLMSIGCRERDTSTSLSL